VGVIIKEMEPITIDTKAVTHI